MAGINFSLGSVELEKFMRSPELANKAAMDRNNGKMGSAQEIRADFSAAIKVWV